MQSRPSNDLLELRNLGSTGIAVTGIGIGGSPLGGAAPNSQRDVPDEAVSTVRAVLDGPVNFLDTSNAYSGGESERRIGRAVAERGGLPEGFVLATKVDADPTSGRFDGDRVRRSFEESLERLGVDRVPLLHLHDPENFITVSEATGRGGAVEALTSLREQGVVDAIGIAGGTVAEMMRYVETEAFDVLLTHNRYTLVDRSARSLIDSAAGRGMGVINAAAYGGGVLARRPRPGDRYAYGMGTTEQVAAASAMFEACERYGVPLAAAALRFAGEASGVHAVLVGASSPERIDEALRLSRIDVPVELMDELETLVPAPEYWITM